MIIYFQAPNDSPSTQWLTTAVGVLKEKRHGVTGSGYADSIVYTYDANGLVESRTGGRGITATYGYTPAGQIETVTYSGLGVADIEIPSINYTYDSRGQLASVTGGNQDCVINYDPVTGELAGEDWEEGPLDGYGLVKSYDHVKGEYERAEIVRNSESLGFQKTHFKNSHIPVKVETVMGATNYLEDSSERGTVGTVSFSKNDSSESFFDINKSYDINAGGSLRLRSVSSNSVHSVLGEDPALIGKLKRELTYGKGGGKRELSLVQRSDGTYWYHAFGRSASPRCELFNSNRWYNASPNFLGFQSTDYRYDFSGNRTRGRNPNMGIMFYERYGTQNVNELNQYTKIEYTGGQRIFGTAQVSDIVLVNGNTVQQAPNQDPFWNYDIIDTGPKYMDIDVTINGVADPASSGVLFVPAPIVNPQHDDDGNLILDARWTYQWDAENRLRKMTTIDHPNMGAEYHCQLEFYYDWIGRRIQKIIRKTQNDDPTENDWYVHCTETYVYDGWNLMHRRVDYEDGTLNDFGQNFSWGLDITQSLDNSGGVGALLAIEELDHNDHPLEYYATMHGLHGNIVAVVKEGNDAPVVEAKYDYAGFGEINRRTGPKANWNPFQFSSKFCDVETGFSYYGYRYYNPIHGRWISRDPIGEAGGSNLYRFVDNDPINNWDYLGLSVMAPPIFLPPVTPRSGRRGPRDQGGAPFPRVPLRPGVPYNPKIHIPPPDPSPHVPGGTEDQASDWAKRFHPERIH